MNIFSILPTGHIVIGFCRTLKMWPIVWPLGTLESDGWAHSKCTQHVPTGHIWVTQQGIFKMYSAFDHWTYWSQMLTAISMFSPCTQWVFGPLSPVTGIPITKGIRLRRCFVCPECWPCKFSISVSSVITLFL